MDDQLQRAQALSAATNEAIGKLSINALKAESESLAKEMERHDFWNDTNHATVVTKRHSQVESRIKPWVKLRQGVAETLELIELQDDSLRVDLDKQLKKYEHDFAILKAELRFSGPYDEAAAIVGIYAGAGGTDAQDWAQMLYRMYFRWADQHKYDVTLIDESPGEEAGLKSVTFQIEGPFAYGKLKSEHGVHRLVRLSPFNADNLRQTSFAKVEVLPKIDKPEAVIMDEKELKIDVFRSGGHGGQSVNTTDSAVRVTHLPTNIVIAIQNERSQQQNKEMAMTILRSKLAQMQMEQHIQNLRELKGPNEQAAWGNQIRSYVLHPYKQIKDLRTHYETSDPETVLNGSLDPFMNAYLEFTLGSD